MPELRGRLPALLSRTATADQLPGGVDRDGCRRRAAGRQLLLRGNHRLAASPSRHRHASPGRALRRAAVLPHAFWILHQRHRGSLPARRDRSRAARSRALGDPDPRLAVRDWLGPDGDDRRTARHPGQGQRHPGQGQRHPGQGQRHPFSRGLAAGRVGRAPKTALADARSGRIPVARYGGAVGRVPRHRSSPGRARTRRGLLHWLPGNDDPDACRPWGARLRTGRGAGPVRVLAGRVGRRRARLPRDLRLGSRPGWPDRLAADERPPVGHRPRRARSSAVRDVLAASQ